MFECSLKLNLPTDSCLHAKPWRHWLYLQGIAIGLLESGIRDQGVSADHGPEWYVGFGSM